MQTKMTGAIRFPKTLQAAQRAEHDQWSLGDALLAECGAPGDDSTNNGSFRKLKAAQAELEAHGIEYAEITLRIYRDAAHNFPPDTRISGVSHRVHIECRSPAMLNAVLAAWKLEKPGQPLALHACARLLVEIRRQADEANDWREVNICERLCISY